MYLGFLNIHKIFQFPALLGIAEIKLDLEVQAVELDNFAVGLLQGCAEQNHKCLSVFIYAQQFLRHTWASGLDCGALLQRLNSVRHRNATMFLCLFY
jgi:hypothetical protein